MDEQKWRKMFVIASRKTKRRSQLVIKKVYSYNNQISYNIFLLIFNSTHAVKEQKMSRFSHPILDRKLRCKSVIDAHPSYFAILLRHLGTFTSNI